MGGLTGVAVYKPLPHMDQGLSITSWGDIMDCEELEGEELEDTSIDPIYQDVLSHFEPLEYRDEDLMLYDSSDAEEPGYERDDEDGYSEDLDDGALAQVFDEEDASPFDYFELLDSEYQEGDSGSEYLDEEFMYHSSEVDELDEDSEDEEDYYQDLEDEDEEFPDYPEPLEGNEELWADSSKDYAEDDDYEDEELHGGLRGYAGNNRRLQRQRGHRRPSAAHHDLESYTFEQYLLDFNKSYDDPHEYQRRSEIFASNVQEMMEHNAGNHSWTKGINQFADWTNDEFRQNMLMDPRLPRIEPSYSRRHSRLPRRGRGSWTRE